MVLALAVLAVSHLVLGLFMAVAPGAFYDALGAFPPENHHYIRDVATFYLAFGVALGVAVWRPSWRGAAAPLGPVRDGVREADPPIDGREGGAVAHGRAPPRPPAP